MALNNPLLIFFLNISCQQLLLCFKESLHAFRNVWVDWRVLMWVTQKYKYNTFLFLLFSQQPTAYTMEVYLGDNVHLECLKEVDIRPILRYSSSIVFLQDGTIVLSHTSFLFLPCPIPFIPPKCPLSFSLLKNILLFLPSAILIPPPPNSTSIFILFSSLPLYDTPL